MNQVILMGRLASDTELRYAGSKNTTVCKFNLAVERPTKKGEEKKADFFKITSWGKIAEFINTYFEKGQRVLVVGSLRNNTYEDKNGVKHFSNDIHAMEIHFADGKKEKVQGQSQPQTEQFFNATDDDSDLPF
jgi:single-strand DNA-binding protein